MKSLIFHPEAAEELTAACDYYARIDQVLVEEFELEVHEVLTSIQRLPRIRGFQFGGPARSRLLHKFDYMIVFLERDSEIVILAVMHTKRRPDYWLKRVTDQ